MDRIRIKALGQAVEQHLAEHGARNWKLLQSRFADVPHATFWRTVKAVRTADAQSDVQPSIEQGAIYFFPPSCEPMKKLIEFQDQVRYADELIVQSKGQNGAIKNWQMYAKGLTMRQTALDRQLDALSRLVDADRTALLFALILHAVEAEAPAVRGRLVDILGKVLELNPKDYERLIEKVAAEKKKKDGYFENWPWKVVATLRPGRATDGAAGTPQIGTNR